MKFSVIFDMDGVLLDTIKHIPVCLNIGLEKYGICISNEDFLKRFNGISIKDSIKIWNEEHNLNMKHDEFLTDINNAEIRMMKDVSIESDLLNFLTDLKMNNISMAVGTSSQKYRATRILKSLNIEHFFNVIIAGEDVSKHKPNPDIFLKAAEKIGTAPKNCIVIEDAPLGIEAGKNAGMTVIGLLTNYYKKRDLKRADLIINDFSDISYDKILELVNN